MTTATEKLIQINSFADFKNKIQVGVKVGCIWHLAKFTGRDEKGNATYTAEERPAREVSIKQTNSFALKTTKTDGTTVDSWCHYPKASLTEIRDNKVLIYELDRENNKVLVLTYWLIENTAE